jgi:cell division protease FtsH
MGRHFLALFFAVSLFGSRGDVGATQMQYSDFRAKVARAASMSHRRTRISGH